MNESKGFGFGEMVVFVLVALAIVYVGGHVFLALMGG